MAAVAQAAAPIFGDAPPLAIPPSRDDLLLFDQELREHYRAATLLPDGRSRRGRKTKHDTATRRWIDTVGYPCIHMGKIPPESDLRMLRLSPRSSLRGPDLAARDAWSQLHGRDPRSRKETAAEQKSKQTLLLWARTNMAGALVPSMARRGRVSSWTIDFGGTWNGYSPRQLTLAASPSSASRSSLPPSTVPPGAFLTWVTGQCPLRNAAPFKWHFPKHFYLYLALRELEAEGRAVTGNDGPILLALPHAAHVQYERYANIRLAPIDIDTTAPGDDDHEEDAPPPPPSPADAAADEPRQVRPGRDDAHYSLLTTHYSLLTTHYSLLTTDCSSITTRLTLTLILILTLNLTLTSPRP
jgi:hypothetical protein